MVDERGNIEPNGGCRESEFPPTGESAGGRDLEKISIALLIQSLDLLQEMVGRGFAIALVFHSLDSTLQTPLIPPYT